jgi:hypothetical protein
VDIEIQGRNLPGRTFTSESRPLGNVHVAVQERKEAVDQVVGDAPSATWTVSVQVTVSDDGALDWRGPCVHGRRGERFLYLTWGEVEPDGTFTMFRRAKLMLDRIDPRLVHEALRGAWGLIAAIDLTDERGGPRCARVDPPALQWELNRP